MNNFQRYDSYKDSGVNWLGRIPAHWEVVRSKRLFQQRVERARKDDEQLTASQKLGVIPQNEFMELEGRRVTQVEFNRDILKHIEPNDFLISMRSFQGGIEFSKYRGCVSSAYVVLTPVNTIVPEFYQYLLKSDGYIRALSSTSNLVRDGQALRFENFSLVDLIAIPRDEQIAIAQFLDSKLPQIDNAIAQKEKLIELLQERRQILINDAVTRGLDPNARMKHSGLDCIGDVPEHWFSVPLYTIATPKSVTGCPERELLSVYLDKGVIKFSDVDEKRTNPTSHDLSAYKAVDPGDFVLNNQQAWRGSVGVSNYRGIVSPAYIVLTLSKVKLNSRFANYMLRNRSMVSQYLICSRGVGTIQRNLYWPQLKRVNVVFPSLDEQKAIADYIDAASAKIETTISFKRKEIEKLTEYKAVLINSAVTGKFKVCGNGRSAGTLGNYA